MKKILSSISVCLMLVVLLSLLTSCSAKKKFVGTWEELDTDGASTGATLVLANDGTGSMTSSDGISGSVTWSAEKGKIFITVSLCGMTETHECTYVFSGNTMILVDEDGEKTVYRKK